MVTHGFCSAFFVDVECNRSRMVGSPPSHLYSSARRERRSPNYIPQLDWKPLKEVKCISAQILVCWIHIGVGEACESSERPIPLDCSNCDVGLARAYYAEVSIV